MSIEGILIINKPAGLTSFDVIRRLRKILKIKKMGHTGTLDPMAEGVLPIFIGAATKQIPNFADGIKGYVAEITLGIETDTLDREGKVTKRIQNPNDKIQINQRKIQLEKILAGFIGEIEQVPPMYSAVHHAGKRLYELAREGKTVERQPRKVTIHSIKLLEIIDGDFPKIKIAVLCSKGTYIRTLADDIGKALSCGAHLSALTRTLSSPFHIAQAFTLEAVEDLAKIGKVDTIIIRPWAEE
ncbi:MAG: tRNA pseudouridine(55) synthase TruB [Candidatus Margulisiibacteriota bacterium]